MSWFFILAIFLSFCIALYLGCRLLFLFNQHQSGLFSSLQKKIFWGFITIVSLSFVITRLLTFSVYWAPLIGNYIFAFIMCAFFTLIIFDIGFIIYKLFNRHKKITSNRWIQGGYTIIVLSMFVIGLHAASTAQVAYYETTINKPANIEKLRIVQMSDIHISEITSLETIADMVKQVNQLNPDLIFITGDTLDMRLAPFVDGRFATQFAQLSSNYGTFITFGNHEHYGMMREENNSEQAIIQAFESGHMTVLKDNVLYYPQLGVYIIGRDDYFNNQRASLDALLTQTNSEQPILLLDHQPRELDNAAELGIDVMFSGHTHAGQSFPVTILVKMMYKNAWGIYQQINNNHLFTSIVTSGYGLWGPPVRILTNAEIVVMDIKFTNN